MPNCGLDKLYCTFSLSLSLVKFNAIKAALTLDFDSRSIPAAYANEISTDMYRIRYLKREAQWEILNVWNPAGTLATRLNAARLRPTSRYACYKRAATSATTSTIMSATPGHTTEPSHSPSSKTSRVRGRLMVQFVDWDVAKPTISTCSLQHDSYELKGKHIVN